MKLNKQRNQYLLEYLQRAYDAYLLEAVRAEIGEPEYLKNLPFIREKVAEKVEWIMGTTEHYLEEVLGELNESKAV